MAPLHDRITETLDRFGKKDAFGKGDYWLVDEYLHAYRHDLEIQNLSLLRPEVIKALQELFHGYPDWEIFYTVDPGKEKWPGMGIIIRDDGSSTNCNESTCRRNFEASSTWAPSSRGASRPRRTPHPLRLLHDPRSIPHQRRYDGEPAAAGAVSGAGGRADHADHRERAA